MAAVYFINERKSLDALPGTNLHDLALRSGIPLYRAPQRILHLNLKLGSLRLFSTSDIVEVEGKGTNSRSDEELKALEGRFLAQYKVTPNLRIASQVTLNGNVTVKTFAARELDKRLTKERMGYLAVVAGFGILMIVMFALVGLDLIKKM